MKKRIGIVLSMICLLGVLCACTQGTNNDSNETDSQPVTADEYMAETTEAPTTVNTVETTTPFVEPTGVPDAIVLGDADIPENAEYEIVHNYDADMRVDKVLLELKTNAKFGSKITRFSFSYQYDRSTDSWEKLDSSQGQGDDLFSLDANAFLNGSPFTGNTNDYHRCTYSISVLDLDVENKKATIQYALDFTDNADVNTSATVDLWYANDGEGPYFTIPYTRSRVVRFEIYFKLDMNEGIQFVQ